MSACFVPIITCHVSLIECGLLRLALEAQGIDASDINSEHAQDYVVLCLQTAGKEAGLKVIATKPRTLMPCSTVHD